MPNFPTSLETYGTATNNSTDVMAEDVNLLRRTVEQLQIKVGIDSSGVVASHDYKHFPSATTMVFGDNAAPQGWTRKDSWQDGAMFVYASAGDLVGGGATSSFAAHGHATGDQSLSVANLPSHNHAGSTAAEESAHTHPSGSYGGSYASKPSFASFADGAAENTGAGSPHTHTITVAAQGSGTTHNHGTATVNTAPYYQELLAAVKN